MSEEKDKPVFDEQTLATFLEAAYVLQEHNRRLAEMELRVQPEAQSIELVDPTPAAVESDPSEPRTPPKDDYTQTLAQIVETQHQIQVRHLELDHAMSLVAERVVEIARAHGSAIGIVEGKSVGYRAASGLLTLPVGTKVPTEKALCVACLRTGQVIRCTDVNTEFLLDAEECSRRGIESLIAVPVYHDGGIAGALELYYPIRQGFGEQDVHTCQLMAGLITEALARSEELTSKQSLASERAAMLEALEKLKPNLAALVDVSHPDPGGDRASSPSTSSTLPPSSSSVAPSSSGFVCPKCGHQFAGEEQFCGKCGLARGGDYGPADLQSKVASLWHMQEARNRKTANGETSDDSAPASSLDAAAVGSPAERLRPTREANTLLDEMEGSRLRQDHEETTAQDGPLHPIDDLTMEKNHAPALTLRSEASIEAWSSAAAAKDFLEQLADPPNAVARLWKTHRGDIYLAIAVLLVLCVIGWGIMSRNSVSATGGPATAAGHRAPDADLSFFDRMLIKLGLADPPEPPENKGNPDTQVWVDLQTALYYCPGADLYGKTPKGRFATQRAAQLDAFEPASRKVCN